MGLLDLFRQNKNNVINVERDLTGGFFYELSNNKTNYTDVDISQYALKTVIKKIADTGKLANINLYENEKLVKKNYLYYYQKKPNAFQTWTDFIEDYLTRISLGSVYLYKNPTGSFNAHYFLDYSKFDDKTKEYLKKISNKLVLSETLPKESHIIYYGKDKEPIKLKDVAILYNSDNLISLKKVLSNSESALDSKNINLHFSQKFLGYQKAGKEDIQLQIQGLSNTEREDLNRKLLSKTSLHVSGKSDIEIKRLVENLKAQGLDETFLNDLMLVAIYFDVPTELIFERGKGLSSQGDAKEKAFTQFVTMCLQPKLQRLTDLLELSLNENQEVRADFNHLPMLNYLETQKLEQLILLQNVQSNRTEQGV